MDKYQVKINPKAISELDYIYNYIAIEKLASENARAQINRVKNAILGLDTFPESHQVRTEGRYARKYRQLLIDNYIVIDLWRKTHTLACGMKATFHLIYT